MFEEDINRIVRAASLIGMRKSPDLYIQIELSGICNAGCEFCDGMRRPKEQRIFMDTQVAKKVVREAREMGAAQISFHITGESLMHPDFLDIVPTDYPSLISTNCLLLEGDLAKEIARRKNLGVVMAVLWSEPDKIFSKSLNNAVNFLEMKPKNRVIVVQMVTSEHAIRHAQSMVEMFYPYKYNVPQLQLHFKQPYTQEPQYPIKGYIPDVLELPGFIMVDRMATPQSCGIDCMAFSPNPACSILVQSDGQLKPCFIRWPRWVEFFGNAKDTTLQEFWNSDNLVMFRKHWCRGDPLHRWPCHDCIRMARPLYWWEEGGTGVVPTELTEEQKTRSGDPFPYPKF